MSRKVVAFTVLPAALFVVAAAAKPTTHVQPVSNAAAESFWACPSGYAFAVNQNAAHCKKPAYTATKRYVACTGVTPTTRIDLVGTTDMCAGTGVVGTITAEPICDPVDVANGYTKRRVSGTDFCGKDIPASIMAPNQLVSR